MYNFKNDYSEGAHPRILEKLVETNLIQQLGYGEDDYSKEAKTVLRNKINNQHAVIHFLSGGTQTNLLVISFLLRVHEAVISAKTGHISANETGAIEATGHKVITVETADGKLTPEDILKILKDHALAPHVVKPRIVYISNSTEIGTTYSLAELKALYACCQQHQLLLYVDGARLGHALTAENNDLTFAAIAKYSDVFYIGGTKNGALLGEAVVFNRPELASDFDYAIKQKGALLAKGRVLSIQFLELFKDDLYLELALKANSFAMRMAKAIKEKGYSFLTESTTNQIFPILPKSVIETLSLNYQFYIWKEIDHDHAAIRLITSWATDETQVNNFVNDILSS
ncbi:MAG: aminotransferase class I/II-fold pyridoxal phosphate-dependent enzyme [Sphingobacterium sp.]|jgi:threonine aldolase|uniref:threonine aldolase family protein n=1 Tax=Sphingobacterium sp. TaxID=341027 RepID=UPI00282FDDF7|nr:aminotransferase class I/II-fold pyridoxal phosphate-dependent enzyme [Sphingobacterium sp.]MDR0263557.1 aminotransferase class I/II-fold pyridoxal phosphate-dependent enzyme [Sphingobacterium sp.]